MISAWIRSDSFMKLQCVATPRPRPRHPARWPTIPKAPRMVRGEPDRKPEPWESGASRQRRATWRCGRSARTASRSRRPGHEQQIVTGYKEAERAAERWLSGSGRGAARGQENATSELVYWLAVDPFRHRLAVEPFCDAEWHEREARPTARRSPYPRAATRGTMRRSQHRR